MALALCSRPTGRHGYKPSNMNGNGAIIEDFTVYYGGVGAVWPCDHYHRFKNIKVLDTGMGDAKKNGFRKAAFISAFPAFIDDSLFVSNSKLANNNPQSRAAFGIYDFGTVINNSHFVNYAIDQYLSPLFTEVGGAVTFMYQGFKNLTRDNSDLLLRVGGVNYKGPTGNVIRDLDGSISGETGRWSIVPKNDLMRDSSCTNTPKDDHGVLCPYYYAQVNIETGSINKLPAAKFGRTDTLKIKTVTPHANRKFYQLFPAINNNVYHQTLDFNGAFSNKLQSLRKITIKVQFGISGDTVMIGLKKLKSGAKVTKSGWSEVSSLKALQDLDGRGWYKSGNTLHLKFKFSGNNKSLGGIDRVDINF